MVELTSRNEESSTMERPILERPKHSSGRVKSTKARNLAQLTEERVRKTKCGHDSGYARQDLASSPLFLPALILPFPQLGSSELVEDRDTWSGSFVSSRSVFFSVTITHGNLISFDICRKDYTSIHTDILRTRKKPQVTRLIQRYSQSWWIRLCYMGQSDKFQSPSVQIYPR